MTRNSFPLFQSHLDLAHSYWKKLVVPGDIVVDATCGNGFDTQYLLSLNPKKVFAYDIQQEAIDNTRKRIEEDRRVSFILGSHECFLEEIVDPKLIIYNLGYLPGGDKSKTTKVDTTLKSIQSAMKIVANGGGISITCYPGHPEGALEEEKIIKNLKTLDPKQWSCCHHRWLNRMNSPSLILLLHSR